MDAQETSIYHAIIISGVIIGIIMIYFIFSITRHQRRNFELHRQNILAEITALEQDRGRIAADLHDELGPILSSIKMKINSFELTDQSDRIQLGLTNKYIDDLLTNIRNISLDLMPAALHRKGLVVAVKEFVDYLNNNNATKFKFQSEPDLVIGEETGVHIYRIIQEVANNAIKHAAATEVLVDFKTTHNLLHIQITDNGRGFDARKEASDTTGIGLRNMLSRTQVINGKMFLEAVPGKGTSYSFEIPI